MDLQGCFLLLVPPIDTFSSGKFTFLLKKFSACAVFYSPSGYYFLQGVLLHFEWGNLVLSFFYTGFVYIDTLLKHDFVLYKMNSLLIACQQKI